MGFLERVLSVKRKEVEVLKEKAGDFETLACERANPPDFERALRDCRTKIIAEVKRRSPSSGDLRDVDAVSQALAYEKAGASAISVLTDETFFGGSPEDLSRVAESVKVPVLRKDFIIDKIQVLEARALGASAVLLIVRILKPEELAELISFSGELGLTPLVEVFSLDEADLALGAGAEVIGINNRDLDTLELDIGLSYELAPRIKEMGARFVVSESGIEKREQIIELINLGVDAFLIGTALMKSEDPESFLKELMGFSRCG